MDRRVIASPDIRYLHTHTYTHTHFLSLTHTHSNARTHARAHTHVHTKIYACISYMHNTHTLSMHDMRVILHIPSSRKQRKNMAPR